MRQNCDIRSRERHDPRNDNLRDDNTLVAL
jgi:hypothetical protein